MAVVTAYGTLETFGGTTGQAILIHGAGSMIGYAAVQIALLRGARVLATAGSTYAGDLAAMGATVTSYGQGMAERVLELAGGPVDLVLDTAPAGGALPDLVTIADGDPRRVMTVSDFAAAAELGVRSNLYALAIPQAQVRQLPGRDHQLNNNLGEVAEAVRINRPRPVTHT